MSAFPKFLYLHFWLRVSSSRRETIGFVTKKELADQKLTSLGELNYSTNITIFAVPTAQLVLLLLVL